MHTVILDPEATKVCKPSTGKLPVRYLSEPASEPVRFQDDFVLTSEHLNRFASEIEQRIASGEHPALACGNVARGIASARNDC